MLLNLQFLKNSLNKQKPFYHSLCTLKALYKPVCILCHKGHICFPYIFTVKIFFYAHNKYTRFIDNCQCIEYKIKLLTVIKMISYEPFYKTLKEKNITTYKLIKEYNISRSLLDRLKHNKPISSVTVNDLCKILECNVSDIMTYINDEN